jgi:hypothetical protein
LEALTRLGWTVIRLREALLRPIGNHDAVVPSYATDHKLIVVAARALASALRREVEGLAAYIAGGEVVATQAAEAHIEMIRNRNNKP